MGEIPIITSPTLLGFVPASGAEILLGLFFISVGMTVDYGLLISQAPTVAIGVFALIGFKMAILFGLGVGSGYSVRLGRGRALGADLVCMGAQMLALWDGRRRGFHTPGPPWDILANAKA